MLTETGTLSVRLLDRDIQWHEDEIKGDTYEQLVHNILHVMRKVELCKVCSGIYNQEILEYSKQKLLTTTCDFSVESNWTIPHAFNNTLIKETVRSGRPNECLVLIKDTGRSERCKNCQRLWNNSLRFKLTSKQNTSSETLANSRVRLSLLSNQKLLERARNMSKEINKLREINWNLRKLVRKRKKVAF